MNGEEGTRLALNLDYAAYHSTAAVVAVTMRIPEVDGVAGGSGEDAEVAIAAAEEDSRSTTVRSP